MDRPLAELLHSILETDPREALDDKHRQALVWAMFGSHTSERYRALWKFANTIADELKRSIVLTPLSRRIAESGPIYFGLAEQVARSIPLPYWCFSALAHVASEQLRRS